jgi:hypothetical protein
MENTIVVEKLTPKQIALMDEIRKFFSKKSVVTRGELVTFMTEKKDKKYAPGFIVKNTAFKVVDAEGNTQHGKYRLLSLNPKTVRERNRKSTAPVTTEAIA